MNIKKFVEYSQNFDISMVIDIGCHNFRIARKILDIIGKEVNLYGLDIAFFRQPNFVVGDIFHVPFKKNIFDLAILSNVIEHLIDPILAFKSINYILKSGGAIYIETPSLFSCLKMLGINFYDDPTHKRPYTKESIRRLANYTGFDVKYIEYTESILGDKQAFRSLRKFFNISALLLKT
jgi:SAM-dependent methyltransferase